MNAIDLLCLILKWDASKHPRDARGRFSSGGGGSKKPRPGLGSRSAGHRDFDSAFAGITTPKPKAPAPKKPRAPTERHGGGLHLLRQDDRARTSFEYLREKGFTHHDYRRSSPVKG